MVGLVDKFKKVLEEEQIRREDKKLADNIRTNSKYTPMLVKLEELYNKRQMLYLELADCEHNIDACLVFIQMVREKEDLEQEKTNAKK